MQTVLHKFLSNLIWYGISCDEIWDVLQVPPAELEHLLQSIPEIADAAVVP